MNETQKLDILPQGEGIICPSCGKFVGAYERCPHCQTVVQKRLPILYIKRFAIIGTIIGLVLMWYAALQRVVPLLKIGDIKPQHNMALVRCVGKVTGIRFMEDKNTFNLKIDDDTGMLSLAGFDKLKKFRAFFGDGFPSEGDLVEVTGNLSLSEKFGESMFISDPRRLKVLKKFQAEPVTIENINMDSRGAVFTVRVKIAAVRKFRVGTNLTVTDDTGSMDLSLFDNDMEKIPDPKVREQLTEVGNEFEMVVLVDAYKGKPQLKIHNPDRAESVKKLAGRVESPKKLEIPVVKAIEVREDRLREILTVIGRVAGMKEFQFGTSIDLKDDSGTVNVWLRENVSKAVQPGLLKEGVALRVTGEVSKFKDRLQVLPASESDVKVEPAAGPAAAPAPAIAPAPASTPVTVPENQGK